MHFENGTILRSFLIYHFHKSLLTQTKGVKARNQTTKKEGIAKAIPSFLELVDGLRTPILSLSLQNL